MWLIIGVWCVENDFERLIDSFFMLYHNCVGLNLSFLLKWSSPHNLCEHVICIDSEIWLGQVFCKLRKNKKSKRMYHFKGRARAATDIMTRQTCATAYIMIRRTCRTVQWILFSKEMPHAAINFFIKRRVARRDRYTSPVGPEGLIQYYTCKPSRFSSIFFFFYA